MKVLICLVLLMISGCSDAQNSVYGKYTETGSENQLILNEDGTFLSKEGAQEMHGTYEVNGTELTLKLGSGRAATGSINEDGSLTDPSGAIMTKQN